MKRNLFAVLILALCVQQADSNACTTVVVSGRATIDGRPLLWKNRDTWQQQNEVIYDDRGKFAFVGVVNAEASKSVWMGTNAAGLCIENSLSRDLDDPDSDGPGNGTLIRRALESCATVADFEQLLIHTNQSGRQTQGNFGVIDAHGGAMLYEVGSHAFRRYNANDPATAPKGYIVRANASVTGLEGESDGDANASVLESVYSSKRYCRARDLCAQRLADQKIDVRFLLQTVARDVSELDATGDDASQTVNTSRTLNRNTTVSAVVFQGVMAGESPIATTMWTILGEPMFSVAVPTWVAQQRIDTAMNGDGVSQICDLATKLRSRNYQFHTERRTEKMLVAHVSSIKDRVLGIESRSLKQTLDQLKTWRESPPESYQLWRQHRRASQQALQGLAQLCQVAAKPQAAADADGAKIHCDFQFEENGATRLGDTVDSVGQHHWDGGLTDCTTKQGSFRIRRNKTEPVNRYVDIKPDVRVKANNQGDPKSHRGWIVVQVAGWNLRGKTPNEVVRVGFTSRTDGHLHVAGLQFRRTGDDEVTIDGIAFGDGATPIVTTKRWSSKQLTPVTFVIELDKVDGNNGEGDSGGSYRLFSKTAKERSFKQLGKSGKVRRLRNGNFLHLHVEGFFAAKDEYFDLERIQYTTTNPVDRTFRSVQ